MYSKVIYFSLRWYDPDQVQRVKSQSVNTDTPKVWDEVSYFLRMDKIFCSDGSGMMEAESLKW
ncbi:hypothetical protein HX13_02640 [Chryseobacterium sp. P1-3]|nr:hypothetical protein HX13_02640 [Chryseobacterium sp. P1-3]